MYIFWIRHNIDFIYIRKQVQQHAYNKTCMHVVVSVTTLWSPMSVCWSVSLCRLISVYGKLFKMVHLILTYIAWQLRNWCCLKFHLRQHQLWNTRPSFHLSMLWTGTGQYYRKQEGRGGGREGKYDKQEGCIIRNRRRNNIINRGIASTME